MARNQGLTMQLSALVSEEMKARINALEAAHPVSRGDVVRDALLAGLPTVEAHGVGAVVAGILLTGQISVLVTEEMKARIDALIEEGRGGGRVVRRALEAGLASVEVRLERERDARTAGA